MDIKIEFPPEKTININGKEFKIAVSDIEALTLASKLSKDFSELKADSPEKVLKTVENAIGALDILLGRGSVNKITGGKALNAAFILEKIVLPVLKAVLELSGEEYEKNMSEKYDLKNDIKNDLKNDL